MLPPVPASIRKSFATTLLAITSPPFVLIDAFACIVSHKTSPFNVSTFTYAPLTLFKNCTHAGGDDDDADGASSVPSSSVSSSSSSTTVTSTLASAIFAFTVNELFFPISTSKDTNRGGILHSMTHTSLLLLLLLLSSSSPSMSETVYAYTSPFSSFSAFSRNRPPLPPPSFLLDEDKEDKEEDKKEEISTRSSPGSKFRTTIFFPPCKSITRKVLPTAIGNSNFLMLLLLFKDDDDDNGANDVNVNDGRIIIALLTIVCTQERRGSCCRSIVLACVRVFV